MTRTLDVYLQAKLVGQLQQEKSGDLTFLYDSDYLHQGLQGISVSLPPRVEAYKGQTVKAFFPVSYLTKM